MRRTTPAAVLAVVVVALAGCAKAAEPDKARLGIASSAAPPASAHPAGPVLTAACPLLSADAVAGTLGVAAPTALERPSANGPDGHSIECMYAWRGGYLDVIVRVDSVNGTADQAVQHSIGHYTGTLDPVPDLGDAALYMSALSTPILVVGRAEGQEMRLITMTVSTTGDPKDKIISLARTVLDRIPRHRS